MTAKELHSPYRVTCLDDEAVHKQAKEARKVAHRLKLWRIRDKDCVACRGLGWWPVWPESSFAERLSQAQEREWSIELGAKPRPPQRRPRRAPARFSNAVTGRRKTRPERSKAQWNTR